MTNEHKKNTSLQITYIDGINPSEAMSEFLESVGAPNYAMKTKTESWTVTNVHEGVSVKLYDKKQAEFFIENLDPADFTIVENETSKYDFDYGENRRYLQDKYFKEIPGKVFTRITWIASEHIEIDTYGYGSSKQRVENMHRYNVLRIKDLLVANKNVHRVNYTCVWKSTKSEECIT